MKRAIQRRARLTAAIERTAIREVAEAVAHIGDRIAARVAAGSDWLPALAQAATVLRARLEISMRRAAIAGANDVTADLPKSSTARLETKAKPQQAYVPPFVLSWVRRHSVRQVERIRKTTAKTIRRQIIAGVQAGWSTDKIAAAIKKATRGNIGLTRAKRIARTEVHTAFERGSYEQALEMKRLGVDLETSWGATEDQRTRPDHAEADGQTVDIGKPFIVGGERLRFPGDPRGSAKQVINCRCTALYYPKGTR